ncbi:MAG: pyruvate carboxylase subunit B [Deltaproteobacteria bacterium]|nr:pyruvate carboxylase subunit B [Deltaproteobacteria bacterium]
MTSSPLRITDTTFRDGHQSILATRLRIGDMIPIAPEMDKVGFHSMEVWGGATFDVCLRFLNEDPWERLHTLKKLMPTTPLQMLLRGQNLVGYRNYPDDVVKEFIQEAAENGIDIFRIFDALNDERNLEVSIKTVKECGRHAQATLCYSLTENRMGGDVFTLDYYVNKATILQQIGADSLCIKDMAGLISPPDTYELIRALKRKLDIPVQLHSHYTSGMASMSYFKATEAGVDIVDTALAPLAMRSSQPPCEPLLVGLLGTERDPGLDLNLIFRLSEYVEEMVGKYRELLNDTRVAVIDTQVLKHQIPGGMISNLVQQLKESKALARLPEVYEEIPHTRKDMGYPPLVTPTSQIVGVQAVLNVLFGRYKVVTQQVKDYFYGLYGRPPAPVNPEIQKIALTGYPRGETPIDCRAADVLEPEMEKAKEAPKGIARTTKDFLIYALYPQSGMEFLKRKYEIGNSG